LKTSETAQPDRTLWESVWKKSTVVRPVHEAILEAVEHVLDMHGAKILEIGCGSAVDSTELALRGARSTAVDYSLHALMHAQRHAAEQEAQVSLAAGDLFRLPFADATFDLVFSQGLLEHFTEPMPAIAEQIRVIRSGGFLCIDVPQTYSLLTLHKRRHIQRGTWFAGWETNYSLPQLEGMMRQAGLEVCRSYGWLYFPSFVYGVRNLHTLNERYNLPIWISENMKKWVENGWRWLEKQRWYYRWMGCIGVIGQKA
jgi:ubiquinone/menaquinone biosynthesis C-methylase UbiE